MTSDDVHDEPVPCPRCGAPIVWVTMEKTRCAMKLEPEARAGGTIERFGPGGRMGRIVPRSERGARLLWVSHHGACRERQPASKADAA